MAEIVAADVSVELDDDCVEMWRLPRSIREEWPDATEREVQRVAEIVLTTLEDAGARLGDIDWDAGEFHAWPADGAIDRAMEAWVRLGRDPNMGEIGWLCKAPPAGEPQR